MRQGNVFISVCQEFCPRGRGVYHTHYSPLSRHSLPSACWDTHPPAQCMLGYTHPCPVHVGIWSTSRWYADTPCPVHAGIHTPLPSACWDTHTPAQCMLGCGQQAGGTHPTGMHSCGNFVHAPLPWGPLSNVK